MVQWFKFTSSAIHQLNEWVGRSVSWLTTVLVALVCFDVITRYLFSNTSAWIMELEWHIFALIFLLGAGYAFRHDRHVRVDLFYAEFSARDQALVNLFGAILFLIPWSILVIYASFDYALISFKIGEASPDPGGLPARYAIKFAITAGAVLLLLQGIASLIDSALVLGGYKEPERSEEPTKENL
ncbi:MAG: TRAP transporter small permease subunit [Phaeodactylibacter sp.]|nr:TRAP transporter small permease subunit [Phaeodactylibacter sp.]MCB9288451.1 TRAP transporter small permease subunit [Lewinellaceae bacterium]